MLVLYSTYDNIGPNQYYSILFIRNIWIFHTQQYSNIQFTVSYNYEYCSNQKFVLHTNSYTNDSDSKQSYIYTYNILYIIVRYTVVIFMWFPHVQHTSTTGSGYRQRWIIWGHKVQKWSKVTVGTFDWSALLRALNFVPTRTQ